MGEGGEGVGREWGGERDGEGEEWDEEWVGIGREGWDEERVGRERVGRRGGVENGRRGDGCVNRQMGRGREGVRKREAQTPFCLSPLYTFTHTHTLTPPSHFTYMVPSWAQTEGFAPWSRSSRATLWCRWEHASWREVQPALSCTLGHTRSICRKYFAMGCKQVNRDEQVN